MGVALTLHLEPHTVELCLRLLKTFKYGSHERFVLRGRHRISNSLKMLERVTKERDIRNLDRAKKEYMVDIVLNWIKVS